MGVRERTSAEATRARIMDVAEEHFRRVGYAKTAVADIAAALGMSPANVYRFFASKAAINDAICRRLFDEAHDLVEGIIALAEPAPRRLARVITALHGYNRSRLTDERRLHDMVEAAMAESWEAIEAHCALVQASFARLIAEGIREGAFDPALDPVQAGGTVFHLCLGLFHPTVIAQCTSQAPDADAERVAAFVLRALRA